MTEPWPHARPAPRSSLRTCSSSGRRARTRWSRPRDPARRPDRHRQPSAVGGQRARDGLMCWTENSELHTSAAFRFLLTESVRILRTGARYQSTARVAHAPEKMSPPSTIPDFCTERRQARRDPRSRSPTTSDRCLYASVTVDEASATGCSNRCEPAPARTQPALTLSPRRSPVPTLAAASREADRAARRHRRRRRSHRQSRHRAR